MKKEDSLVLFGQEDIRRHWDPEKEIWYFSVIDIIRILIQQKDYQTARNYWKVLKIRLKSEGSEVVTKCNQLKLVAEDGKMRLTDVADTETLLRLIQSIPSPKVEPLKIWLARVGYERIEETEDPELAFDRAMRTYLRKGYSKEWINQRLKSIEIRKDLTDEWQESGIKNPKEFAMLTDEITKAWSEMSVKKYKQLKDLKKENLRDNMTNLELVLNMLAETTTTEISKIRKPEGFEPSKKIAHEGGEVAGNARKEIERKTGRPVITPKNARNLLAERDKKSRESVSKTT